MKKLWIFVFCLLLLVGCNTKENEENTNSNFNTNFNDGNTNSNTNDEKTNSNINTENPTDEVGKYTVHLYLFHSKSCQHCQQELAWLESIEGEYSYLKIHTYEVSEEKEIYEKVKSAMKIDSGYVPLTIIGEDYFVGYSDAKGKKFIRTVKEQSKKNYCDVVGTVINGGDVNSCIEKNKGV